MASASNSQPKGGVEVVESWFGRVDTVQEAHALLEASKVSIIPRITHRLSDAERIRLIRVGAVFIFSESSGIKRWTEKLRWSPSRVMGSFLCYTELVESATTIPLVKKSFSSLSAGERIHLIAYTSPHADTMRALPSVSDDPRLIHLVKSIEQKTRERRKVVAENPSSVTNSYPTPSTSTIPQFKSESRRPSTSVSPQFDSLPRERQLSLPTNANLQNPWDGGLNLHLSPSPPHSSRPSSSSSSTVSTALSTAYSMSEVGPIRNRVRLPPIHVAAGAMPIYPSSPHGAWNRAKEDERVLSLFDR